MGNRVSIRRLIAELLGLDLDELLSDQSRISENGKSNGQRLEEIDSLSKDFIRTFINNQEKEPPSIIREIFTGQNFTEQNVTGQGINPVISQEAAAICKRIIDLESRIDASLEIEALLHGFEGGYIPAGPSGLIMRGREDVLPTGRNFYSLDPRRFRQKLHGELDSNFRGF
nr:cobaltochelatase subunit CobN [Methanosarcina horonobensis]